MLTRGVTITSVAGSSLSLIREALQYAADHDIRPLVKVYTMEQGLKALEDLVSLLCCHSGVRDY